MIEIFLNAYTDPTNKVFCYVIGFAFCSGLFFAITHRFPSVRTFIPSFIATLGIFGTFLGIFLGLSHFDSNNISASIPELLDGMKIAFFTSLLGMFFSVMLKFSYNFVEDLRSKGSADPLSCLQNIEVSSQNVTKSISELNDTLKSCFKSDEEYSLVSQVKLIRQEIIDSRRETKEAFRDFSEKFSKMASESIVEELKKVVDKFNAMLNDLVLQSFKDLKESTERLNTWQTEYKDTIQKNQENLTEILEHITTLNNIFNETSEKIDSLSTSFDSMDESLSAISLSGKALDEHSKNLTNQNKLLETSINAIKDAGEKASEVVPTISTKMDEIIEQIKQLQISSDEFIRKTTNTLSENATKISELSQKQIENIEISLNSFFKESSEHMSNLQENSNKFVENATNTLTSTVSEISETSKKQIEEIETALEKELTESLKTFAGAMVQLSQRFTSDYMPLTEKLRDLVRIAEKVR